MAWGAATASCRAIVIGLAAALVAATGPAAGAEGKPNVLFIAIDDLNDWVGCLGGHPQARTPHIDALAARGVNFTRAYCASPVCNPSRTALLTGLRSSSSGVYDNGILRGKTICRDVVPLNTHFHDNGYFVAGAGKIYHGDGDRWGAWDDYASAPVGRPRPAAGEDAGVGGIRFAPIDGDDDALDDFHAVDYCIGQLQRKHDRPLFLACGLHKPHMPRKYYDRFPLESIELPVVPATDLDDVPPAGVAMARAEGDHHRILASGRWKEAVRGYLAAGAFCDAMVGRLLAGLDASPLRDDTIIVLWGDHGWHLGEKQPAEERGPVGVGVGGEPRRLELRQDEPIDVAAGPRAVADRGRGMVARGDEAPVRLGTGADLHRHQQHRGDARRRARSGSDVSRPPRHHPARLPIGTGPRSPSLPRPVMPPPPQRTANASPWWGGGSAREATGAPRR